MTRQTDVQYVQYYTEGSTATKIEPVIQEDTFYFPKVHKHKRKRLYVDPFAVAGTLVAIIMLISMGLGISHLKRARLETAQMEQYISQLVGENQSLSDQYAEGYDLDTVEKTAQALGMVPREEVKSVPLDVTVPELTVQEEPSVWEKISTFFEELFA